MKDLWSNVTSEISSFGDYLATLNLWMIATLFLLTLLIGRHRAYRQALSRAKRNTEYWSEKSEGYLDAYDSISSECSMLRKRVRELEDVEVDKEEMDYVYQSLGIRKPDTHP